MGGPTRSREISRDLARFKMAAEILARFKMAAEILARFKMAAAISRDLARFKMAAAFSRDSRWLPRSREIQDGGRHDRK